MITDKEVAKITYIDVSLRGIYDLKGIEHFTELTTLKCFDNELTTLDVSKNSKLSWLDCYKNQINGTRMEALIESLPVINDKNSGHWGVTSNINEGNEMSLEQVAAAKAKGWKPAYTDGAYWCDYDGGNPLDIKINSKNGLTMSIK